MVSEVRPAFRWLRCPGRCTAFLLFSPTFSQLFSPLFRRPPMNPAAAAPALKVEQLLARLQSARQRSDELFSIVRPAALYDRPVPERHRIIFYLGHLEAFDWNLLREPLGLSSFDPHYDKLFAFGIDPVEGGLPTDQPRDWPTVERVVAYKQRLRDRLDSELRAESANDPTLARLEY